MTAAERELRRQQRQLRAIEDRAGAELRRSYLAVYKRLRENLAVLQAAIRDARAAGTEIKVSWLVNQSQFNILIDDVEREVWAWGRGASETVAEGQRKALLGVEPNQRALAGLSVPSLVRAQVEARFISLSPGAVNAYVGFAGDGKPLGRLFQRIAPDTRQAAQDAITYGIARGQSPRVVAQSFRQAAAVPLERALTISRTEILRAYRTASNDWYKANADVIGGWTWIAALDDRTCIACAALNGTEHTVYETQDAHINCRCSQLPFTKTWKELGFKDMESFDVERPPTPEQSFEALDEATQRSIMGNTRYDLYRSGQITLADNVKVVRSPEWGASNVVRPLKDLPA